VLWVADWELDAFAAGHVSFVTVIVNEMVLLIECSNE
jgi:hypothetical protein